MVRNKNTDGRHNRSSVGKTKKTGFPSANSEEQTPLDTPAGKDCPAASADRQTTAEGQLGFPDRVYLLASIIFQNHHLEKPPAQRLVNYGKERGLPVPAVKDEETQRTAYELAFNTLKYQELLEDIMIDSCLFLSQQMPDDQMSLVAVMLYDFQDRKFLPSECQVKDELIQEVRDVEKYLLRSKTKLAASLARCRIKHDLVSIERILPESVKKKQERSSNLPLYAWVNTQKSSLNEVQSVLKTAGFSQVESIGQLEGRTFCQDPHCGDVLVFPAQLRAQLYSTELLSNHKLIIQDKSCSLGPNAVCSLLTEEGDVLMVGCFSSLTVSHTASLIINKHQANCSVQGPTVYVCVSDRTNAQREELHQAVTAMGCKNVKLIPEDFHSVDGGDKRLQKVRIILLTPKCSVSAVSNPVDFILQENGDTDLLQDLSQDSIAQSKLEALVAQQRKDIDHSLKFPKVSAVIYSTCSSYPDENEVVVNRALEQAKACSEQEGEPRQATFRISPSPFSNLDHAEALQETNPFLMLEPSAHSNGCFLAVLSKEPEPVVKEAPQEVLRRANAKGILDRIGLKQPTRKEHHGHTNRMIKTTNACNSTPNIAVSLQSKKKETKGSSSSTLCGRQEFTNWRPSLQGRVKAQASKNSTSSPFPSSKPESNSSPSLSKVENISLKKTIVPVFKTSTSTTPLHLAPPPAPPPAMVIRPRKAQQEVLKPVVLVFPPVHFPSFFPPQHSRTEYSHSFENRKWRTPTQTMPPSRSSGNNPKDALAKSQPFF
ncbi:putative methyltransferase NSUN7 [Notolabrus celidotus]|uniref:putative methyltransferase NSUN7 n=1 Tax=Notolabrus celidotus TaxID=1203425 RepID=UPI00148F6CA5|nr:putative methyltransferase NSUN7 [Notolabrus celidotus]